MASKTYSLGNDPDGQACTRLVFTKLDGSDVVLTGDYTTSDPEEQAFLDTHPFVVQGKKKGADG